MHAYLREIAEGGDFDHTEAIRALAKFLTMRTVAGEGAPSALPPQDVAPQIDGVTRQPARSRKK